MAKGFITLENGEDFVTRWTGYDMILEIVTKELRNLGDNEFADWLRTRFPNENEEKGDDEFCNSKNEMIQRIIDLRGLTKTNREKFWQALSIGAKNLRQFGEEYSILNPDRLVELMAAHSRVIDNFDIDNETEKEIIVSGDKIDKVGPGW